MQGRSRRDRLRRLLQPLAFRRKSVIRTSLNNYSPRPRRQRRGVVEFAADSPLEGDGFEPSPRRPDSRFSAVFVTLGRIKVDSILDHFWTPANTD